MPSTDAFALKNSDLNAFLFADVGTERNGSALTILSLLARLGQDPWIEAGRWARLPKGTANAMPMEPHTTAEWNATAARLILLLPGQSRPSPPSIGKAINVSSLPPWAPIAFFCAAIALGWIVNMMAAPVSSADAIVSAEQTTTAGTAVGKQ